MIYPRWLTWAEKKFGWIAIPNLPLFLVGIQALGFVLLAVKGGSNPAVASQLASRLVLDPQAVLNGEIWRLFTFIAIPMSHGFWMIFVLWFLYFVFNSLAMAWGDFKLTVYFLIAWVGTVLASLLLNVPVESFIFIESTFFFALATLIPNREILFFLIVPLKVKWIALFSATLMVLFPLLFSDWAYRVYVMVAFLNYLLFFGPSYIDFLRMEMRRRKMQ
ncbi:MAG: hypothetical protein GX801_03010 [Fibrobacter sp.]|nr:hypothetical protein [Fibrobacter sp.]